MIAWIVGAIVVLAVISFGATYYLQAKSLTRQLDEHKAAIKKWQTYSDEKTKEADFYKGQAKELAEQVLKVSKKIEKQKKIADEAKKRMDSVETPQTSTEISERLKEQGYTPEVKCE